MDFETVIAAKEDCERLLKNFSRNSTLLLYIDFVKEWQNMKFSLIFRGRASTYELIEFIEGIFEIAKLFLFPPHSFSERIGAIYLLYGLYFRQPTLTQSSGFVKIRLELREWLSLCEFVEKLKESGHYDACFIFNKIVVSGAIHFVCFNQKYGFEESRKKAPKIEISEASKEDDRIATLNHLLSSDDFLKTWKKKEQEYNSLKDDLLEKNLVKKSVAESTDFVDDLKSMMVSKDSSYSESSIGLRRETLKNKRLAEINFVSSTTRSRFNRLSDIRKEFEETEKAGNLESETEISNQAGPSTQSGRGLLKSIGLLSRWKGKEKVSFVCDDDEPAVKTSKKSNERKTTSSRNMPSLTAGDQSNSTEDLHNLDFIDSEDSLSSDEGDNDTTGYLQMLNEVIRNSEPNEGESHSNKMDAVSLMLFH